MIIQMEIWFKRINILYCPIAFFLIFFFLSFFSVESIFFIRLTRGRGMKNHSIILTDDYFSLRALCFMRRFYFILLPFRCQKQKHRVGFGFVVVVCLFNFLVSCTKKKFRS